LAHLFQANVRRGNMKNIDCKPLRPSVLTITHSAHRAKTDGSNWPISPFLPFCAWLLPVEADTTVRTVAGIPERSERSRITLALHPGYDAAAFPSSPRNPLPIPRKMLRRPPRQRLRGERGVVRPARPHH
jgi:hypothetical protein